MGKADKKSKDFRHGHRERMRKKFADNGGSFKGWAKHEVIEFLLFNVVEGKDIRETAHRLIDYSGKSFIRLFDNTVDSRLEKIYGVGPESVKLLRTFKAFVEYYQAEKVRDRLIKLDMNNAAEILSMVDLSSDKEKMTMICMNSFMQVTAIVNIESYSTEFGAGADTDRLIKEVGYSAAVNVILVHTHPSGNPKPSTADIIMTYELEKILKTLNVFLLDHFIAADNRLISIKNIIREMKRRNGEPDDE